MKTWQQWVGKFLLLGVAVIEFIAKQMGVPIPWAAIIIPAATWAAEFVLGWLPGEAWPKIVGKGLILVSSIVTLVLDQLGLNVPAWSALVPLLTGLAQYLIGLVPSESESG